MSDLWLPGLGGATFVASVVLTGWLRGLAHSRGLVDLPGARSSHTLPTARGGGSAIVIVVLLLLPLLVWRGVLHDTSFLAMMGAGGLVAGIGWLDDHGHVAARWRLVVHFTAAFWALAWLGGLPTLPMLGAGVIDLNWMGHGLAALYLVWLLNLYNFMDGIDGLAGIEAVTVALGGAVLYAVLPDSGDAWIPPTLLAAAVAGFLVWNFPRARIFMGDVGSGFLGLMLGMLSLQAAWHAPQLFWGWVILLGSFVVDATVTLLRRLARRERVYEAHRSHAYQRVARRRGSHIAVTLFFGIINLVWLLPVAAMVATGRLDGIVGVVIAYAPLVWLAFRFGAGQPGELMT